MKIFTEDLAAELPKAIFDSVGALSSALFGALWQNVTNFFPSIFAAISNHDWSSVIIYAIILFGTVVILYKPVRRWLTLF